MPLLSGAGKIVSIGRGALGGRHMTSISEQISGSVCCADLRAATASAERDPAELGENTASRSRISQLVRAPSRNTLTALTSKLFRFSSALRSIGIALTFPLR